MSTASVLPDSGELSLGQVIAAFSKLEKRFDALKKETEEHLNSFTAKLEQLADGSKKLQESLETLAKAQEETIKNYNMLKDEVRSLGGKILERQNPAPVVEVKQEMGLSLFDLFED